MKFLCKQLDLKYIFVGMSEILWVPCLSAVQIQSLKLHVKSFFFRRNVKGFLMNGHQQAVKLDISSLNFKIHFISLPFWVRIIAWRPLRNFSLWGCQVFRSLFPKRYFNTFCYFQIFLYNLLVWMVPLPTFYHYELALNFWIRAIANIIFECYFDQCLNLNILI